MRMRIIIFGCGKIYSNFKRDVVKVAGYEDEVLCFIDNRADNIKIIDNKPVYLPKKITKITFDYVVTMSVKQLEMKEQLICLGVDEKKILSFEKYRGQYLKKYRKIYMNCMSKKVKKSILFITNAVKYDGASIAAVNAALELSKRGYKIMLAAPYVNPEIRNIFFKEKVNILIVPEIKHCSIQDLVDFENFDGVIVNTFSNIRLACELSNLFPVLWWIHEASDNYSKVYKLYTIRFKVYNTVEKMERIRIVAVSNSAAKNFNKYYPNRVNDIMGLGISDFYIKCVKKESNTLNFAVIGSICEIKGQDVIIRALELLPLNVRKKIKIMFIGEMDITNCYGREIAEKIKLNPELEYVGLLTREKFKDIMRKIDVVVCSSREETLSIAVIEGLMNKKICITTDKTGIADYISNGESGFIVPSDSPEKLAGVINDIAKRYKQLSYMREKGRMVYEANFTLKILGDILEKEIAITLKNG